jgi:hypothetical protein
MACVFTFVFINNNSFAGIHFNKIVYIIFENTNYNDAIANPIFKNYAQKGILFTNFLAETHPSQPNYISMIAGSTLNVTNDDNVDLDGKHLGDLLEAKNLSFKSYAENYPGNCFLGKTNGKYARKHVPFLSFKNISQNSSRCLNSVEDSKAFFNDLSKGSLPNFSIFVPDLNDDGHDTGVAVAAKWLDNTFGQILADPTKLGDTVFVLTFDESSRIPLSNHIYTVAIGANIKAGTNFDQSVSHITLLKMVEDEFDLGNLGRGDKSAITINSIWK